MKKFRELSEAVKDKYDIGEYDQEGDMAKSDLRSIIANSKRVHDMLKDDDNLPEWVQSKITKAEDYMSTVANYLEAEMNEEVELDEAIRHEIAGQVGRFIGNKIDPVHGDILHAHGKEAYRQAAYHIRKTIHHVSQAVSDLHDKLHHSLKTGVPMKIAEDVEHLEEKNVPTSPEKWAQAKAQAKAKFDVYPSAYANGWAAKKYKEMGGGWKSVNEAKDDVPFKADKPEKQIATPGKYGAGYSAARHLARMGLQKQIEKQKKPVKEAKDDLPFKSDKSTKQIAKPGKFGVGYSTAKHLAKMAMQKQMQKMKKPVKEETMSKKAKIVKDAMKKPSKDDQFQAEPMISQSIVKNN